MKQPTLALRSFKRNLGKEHLKTLSTLDSLAEVLKANGEFDVSAVFFGKLSRAA